ncbi:MAG: hypothetical protein JWO06_2797 [Bacteroidota bacterium]|nr:hypothetical protein [Bacteroidota bacterium]
MEHLLVVTGLIILVNLFVTYRGLADSAFLYDNCFDVDGILIRKEYKRLLTSGFLHISWTHLFFNMVSLFAFGDALEPYLGPVKYTIIYFGALVGGNLFALYVHRSHGDYTAVGASGAVCGVIYACIALFPQMDIGFIFFRIHFPAWLYGTLYVLYCIYGIKTMAGNVGHEAHLGGALAGMVVAIIMNPEMLLENYLPIILTAVPSAIFIYMLVTRPEFMLVDNYFSKKRSSKYYTVEDRYNKAQQQKQQEIDRLLDKISKKGIQSLSKLEKDIIDNYSKTKH